MGATLLESKVTDWVGCLHCLHVWYSPIGQPVKRECPQCGDTKTKNRIDTVEVTHALRRHWPITVKQARMKYGKNPKPLKEEQHGKEQRDPYLKGIIERWGEPNSASGIRGSSRITTTTPRTGRRARGGGKIDTGKP